MRRARVSAFVASGLVVAGTAAGIAVAAAPASAKSTGPVVMVQCSGAGQVRPAKSNEPGCMPSNEFIGNLSWTSWRSTAFGHGALEVNNCTPSCAQGTFVKYPILVVLWRAEPGPGHAGRHFFSRLTWIFTGSSKHRPHGPLSQTMTLRP